MFVDMIVDMISNNRLMPIVTELFMGRETKYFSFFHYATILCSTKKDHT